MENRKSKKRWILGVILVLVISLALYSFFPSGEKEDIPNDLITQETIAQPLDHNEPLGKFFEQKILILKPETASADAPVFFILGNEAEATAKGLKKLYLAYGAPENVIFITAEHRGYGQSISADADQSSPAYVTVSQALADYHRVVNVYKEDFPGPWMAAGYSYGGGLVINYAYLYPDDVKVILASSAVTYWPFYMSEYDRQVKINLGDGLYKRLAVHTNNLKPEEPFDDTWFKREFITNAVIGLSQYQSYQNLLPAFNLLSYLPTETFVKTMRLVDKYIAKEHGWNTALSFGKQSLSHEEALTGKYNWYTWKYQQCHETGTFWVSEDPGGVFPKSEADIINECKIQFGLEPPAAEASPWNPGMMIPELVVPQIYVIGENDPWKWIGYKPEFEGHDENIFYAAGGFHCPERYDLELGEKVLSRMLEHLRLE